MKLLLTKELGRLCKWLRIMGFDAGYFKQGNFSSLIVQALREDRVILTRNHRLADHAGIKTVLINAQALKEQFLELKDKLGLSIDRSKVYSRCTVCNTPLAAVEKNKIKNRIPVYVFNTQNQFLACPECNRIYWQGTHWGNVEEIIKEMV